MEPTLAYDIESGRAVSVAPTVDPSYKLVRPKCPPFFVKRFMWWMHDDGHGVAYVVWMEKTKYLHVRQVRDDEDDEDVGASIAAFRFALDVYRSAVASHDPADEVGGVKPAADVADVADDDDDSDPTTPDP